MTKQRKKDRSGFINSENSDHHGGKGMVGKGAGCCSHKGAVSRDGACASEKVQLSKAHPSDLLLCSSPSILKAPQSSKWLHSLRTKHSDHEPVGNILDTNHNVASLSAASKTEGLF